MTASEQARPVPAPADALDRHDTSLSRSARNMTVLTGVSRATGFVRVAVVTNVLGVTYLANTYQTSNTIPNILFELFAAGALQAVLIPSMVDLLGSRHGGRADAETTHVIGAVLGLTSAVMAALAVVGIALGPWLMRLMVNDVADPTVRAAEVRLGTFFLWFFLPQVVLYAANSVATAVLNATGSFGIPVIAPAINNVVVIGVYLAFAAVRVGRPPSLDLSVSEKVLLAGGTTLGVVLFCALPVAAAHRRVPLRPNLDHRHPRIHRLARDGGWAIAYLGFTQALLVVILQLTNRREGAVAIYTLAWVVFLLPHSLLSVPVLTTRFPTMSRQALAGEWDGYGDTFGRGVRSICFVALPSAAILMATATPLARLIVHGETARSAGEIGAAIRGFAPGLLGLGMFLFLTRACYAVGDMRSPTWANLIATVVGAVTMVVVADQVAPKLLVASLGVVYAATQSVAAVILLIVVRRRLHREGGHAARAALSTVRTLFAAVVSGVIAFAVVEQAPPHAGTAVVVAYLAVAGLLGGSAYLLLNAALGGAGPRRALRSFGADDRAAAVGR